MIEVDIGDFDYIVIGVDPAVSSGEDSDETGIIVAARGPHQDETCRLAHCSCHAYVLEDATLHKGTKSTPETWGKRVIEAYDYWKANLIVIESNNGKELLRSVLQSIRPGIPVDLPHATAGQNKAKRAEPIVTLYEQGRVHHIGDPMGFAQLEEQMTTWVPRPPGSRGGDSPDRMDALVWAISALDLNGFYAKKKRDYSGLVPIGFSQTNTWSI